MKKLFPILYCGVFIALCLALGLGAFFLPADADGEGRDLAPFPSFTVEGKFNADFFNEFDAWLTDHFTARRHFINANSAVMEQVFHTGSDQVIVGEDGFLFYKDTVADYCGESLLREEEIDVIADSLKAMADEAASYGAKLIVAVAPNKNTVYGEYMPAAYRAVRDQAAGESNMDRLYAALAKRGVLYADLRPSLADAENLTYHKRDTHWNGAGALAAYNAVLDVLALPHLDFSEYAMMHTADFPGDLDGMLYPGAGRTDDNYMPEYDFASSFVYTSASAAPMSMSLTTRGGGEGSLLIFRDSFGSAWIPYFSASFRDVRYERAMPYRIDLLARYPADAVIIEIAERNIPLLLPDSAREDG